MKSCRRCFEWAQIRPDGEVTLCPWNWISVGNLKENNLEEIWHSKKADEIRRAFLDGELLGCDIPSCPHCINEDPEVLVYDADEMKKIYKELPELPVKMCLSFDERCNHACPSCRHGIYVPDQAYKDGLETIYRNIAPYMPKMKLEYFDANGGGEFFCSTEMLDMLLDFHPTEKDFLMRLETNGVLFKDHWPKIEHLGKWMKVSVTPNSYDRATYKYLAGGCDDLEKFEESMAFIAELRASGKIKLVEITMVIQDSNFRQIPEFIHKSLEVYHADRVILRPIFKWFYLTDDELLYKNVLNPCHPYHQEYLEIIKDPVCQDERVWNWGFLVKQESVEFPTLEMRDFYNGETDFEKKVRGCLDTVIPQMKDLLKSNCGQIVIYGAGKVGKIVFKALSCGDEKLPVAGFLVNRAEGNPRYWMGQEVSAIADSMFHPEESLVLIALTKGKRVGVKEKLEENGFKNILMIDEKSDEKLM